MNSFDSIEFTQCVSKLPDEDRNCTAIDETTGEFCGETETLKIIDEFQKLYETRIENVDREFENKFDQVCMKLEISKEWIKNLKEQNIMLVQVVEDLEQAACNRVKLLEEKLKHSSMLVSGNMKKSTNTEKTISTLLNRVSNLEKDEECMQQKIEFLQSDIRGLLELIRRAAQENHWTLDDIKFFEIQPSDIPVPTNCTCDQEDINHKKVQSLKLQIKNFEENEKKMIVHQKELEDKLIDLNAKLQIKEDTIKTYAFQFQNLSDNLRRRVKFTDQIACSTFVENNQETFDNQIVSYLNKVKSLMEQEKEDLSKLKVELEKTVEKLCCEKDEEYKINNESNMDNIKYKLARNIEYVNKIYSKKDELIEIINSLLQIENDDLFHTENLNLLPNTDINQFKLMDIFRECAVEAQITMEDIKDEINMIVSSFKCRHQKYIDLNKEVLNVQNQLIKCREKIANVVNKLQLQEEERVRHNDRIISGENKLKDIKNEINITQSQLSHVNEMQSNENMSYYVEDISNCTNISNYDLLCSIIEEIEQTSSSLQIFQVQGCCIVKDLEKLKNQFCEVDLSTKKLHDKIDETLTEHDIVEITLSQKEQKLQKLEEEVDTIHLKVQDVLETFFSSKEHILHEVLQTKQSVNKLRKEYDDLKYKLSQKSLNSECDKKTCLWKYRVTDLQDQVKILQHEAKCNEEANNFLRNNIQSLEEELHIIHGKADNYRRSHSINNMKLKKKIIELENTLKFQKEIECTLRRELNDIEIELKKSKELLNSSHNEYNMEETLLQCNCYQFRHDTMTAHQLFKKLKNSIKCTKIGLQELKTELKKLICEDSNCCSSARSLMNLLEILQKHESELDNCFQEIEELKNALYSKDKLIENMKEIIGIQKDSIVMTQTELKELHQKYQEKIDNQNQIISQYEKEKKDLSKQNELQIQTIGHLQNAVVEAKKCIDQMGNRTSEGKIETIRLLMIYVEEIQSQYNECFAEAAKQDKLLELQRNAIQDLQQKIIFMEYNNFLAINFIHITHYFILKTIQEQLEIRVNDIQSLKNEIDTLIQSKCYLENKYLNTKKLWQEAEEKLQELRKQTLKTEYKIKIGEDKECQYKIEVKDKSCITQNIFDCENITYDNRKQCTNYSYEHDLQTEIEILIRENEDMKKQLQKYKLDFDIIDKELKTERENDIYIQQISFELQKLRDTECCLQYENEQLKSDLKKQTKNTEDLLEKLQSTQESSTKFEKLLKKLEDKQIQINDLCSQISNNEIVIKKQTEIIEEFEKKLDVKNQQIKAYLSELNEAEEEMSTLHERIQSLKTMLKEKSDNMAKLQADYEVIKNDNSILKMENSNFEDKTKEDICQLKIMLKDLQMQLCFTENNYCRVTEDFNKAQEQLIIMTKREADLQECLTNMERDYCLKLSSIEKEKVMLGNCLDKLRDELEEIQTSYSSKSTEHCNLQDICKSYVEQLDILQQQIEKEREKFKQIEESNRCIIQQLQEYKEQNNDLVKEKSIIEQNNCEIISELRETHKSLLELKRECQLKNKSLACISAELTETAMSRSELCNQSQYVVSCIRIWMEEQREYVNKLSAKLKSQQQELVQVGFEKKVLIDETKRLRHINHVLMQRLKRVYRYSNKNVRNVCVGCQILPKNIDTRFPVNSKYLSSQKKLNFMKATRRISVCNNGWLFPKMKYLVNELQKNNIECSENCFNRMNTDVRLEENHDCGYQSSTSK
ncbi:putative autophagy-related protein 11 isoform X2 [Apis cerana]|uniref:putative autophagy-related protein 11 isoform X2 n=1 Tax=Apis cerana TaxID=7461 RepID=UPI002B22B4E4|nr:putative autophagy-related protein 11 isoform X2 [Apis cerana]